MTDYINALLWMADVILDDDNMTAESTTLPATQSSVKAYTDLGVEEAKDYADLGDVTTLSSAQSYADAQDAATLASANLYADGVGAAALADAEAYADAQDVINLSAAYVYADGVGTATLASAESYADSQDVINLASANSYTDLGLATKQDTLLNGADELTTSEVDQLKNINTTIIPTSAWTAMANGFVGDLTERILDDNPSSAWTEAFIPLTATISDTSTTYGQYHFCLWQTNGATSSNFMDVVINIPKNCYYNGTDNPPVMHLCGTFLGNNKFNRVVASNNGTTGEVSFYLVITNNSDGILDLYCVDHNDCTLAALSTAGTSTSTLANETDEVYFYYARPNSNLSNSGSIKIDSNGDLSEPTYNLAAGTPTQVTYTSPVIDATSVYPPIGPQDSTAIYNPTYDVFMECPVLGQMQTWRITMHYSGKSSNNNTGFYVMLINPISGFTRRMLATLPSGETGNDFLTFEVSTYADSNSLAAPWGTGYGGYELWIETLNDAITVTIKDVARFTTMF